MKSLLMAPVLVLATSGAFAGNEHDHAHMGKTFAEKKAHITQEIEERLTALNGHKSCVTAAADEAALKTCHDKMHDAKMEKRMEHMEKRKERMDKRMEKMKEKMNK